MNEEDNVAGEPATEVPPIEPDMEVLSEHVSAEPPSPEGEDAAPAAEAAPEPADQTGGADETDSGAVVPPADPVLERIDAVAGKLASAEAAVASLRDHAEALQKAVSGYYTQTTDSMHKELEKFRKGLVRKLEQELFGELIEIYDAVDKVAVCAAADPSKAPGLLDGLRDQIDAALFNRGVEKREATVGEKFDPRRHHVVRPDVPTGDAALDGTVAETARPGFDDMDESFKDLRGGCMKLRPVHVRLYRYDPTMAATPQEPVPDSPDAEPTAGPQEPVPQDEPQAPAEPPV